MSDHEDQSANDESNQQVVTDYTQLLDRANMETIPDNWNTIVNPVSNVLGKSKSYSYFPFDQVKSALQKTIRRGMNEAIQWANEMFFSGPGSPRTNLWNRLVVIAVEDIGPANPYILCDICYCITSLSKDDGWNSVLMVDYLVASMVQSKKCRINDWILCSIAKDPNYIHPDAYNYYQQNLTNGLIALRDNNDLSQEDMISTIRYYGFFFWNFKDKKNSPYKKTDIIKGLYSTFNGVFHGRCVYWDNVVAKIIDTKRFNNSSSIHLIYMHMITIHAYKLAPTDIHLSTEFSSIMENQDMMNNIAAYAEKIYNRDPDVFQLMPNIAIDKHTAQGKSRGDSTREFLQVGSFVNNEFDTLISDCEYFKSMFIDIL